MALSSTMWSSSNCIIFSYLLFLSGNICFCWPINVWSNTCLIGKRISRLNIIYPSYFFGGMKHVFNIKCCFLQDALLWALTVYIIFFKFKFPNNFQQYFVNTFDDIIRLGISKGDNFGVYISLVLNQSIVKLMNYVLLLTETYLLWQ